MFTKAMRQKFMTYLPVSLHHYLHIYVLYVTTHISIRKLQYLFCERRGNRITKNKLSVKQLYDL